MFFGRVTRRVGRLLSGLFAELVAQFGDCEMKGCGTGGGEGRMMMKLIGLNGS